MRCVLSGLLALVLIQLSLTAGGLLPPLAGLDPIAAPAAFYGVNLLALAAAMGVAYTVLRDGLAGLRGTPSAETPAVRPYQKKGCGTGGAGGVRAKT